MTLHSEAVKEIDLEALQDHAPGPWEIFASEHDDTLYIMPKDQWMGRGGKDTVAVIPAHCLEKEAKAQLIAAAPELLAECERLRAELTTRRARDVEVEALVAAAKRANGDHTAPHDCYATGPSTGDDYLDLVSCPGCELAAALLPFQRTGAKP